MKALLKVLVLVGVAMTMTGCIAHHAMDAANYIDITRLASSNNPNAVKVYVGKYHFKGGTGYVSAEGEISPWLKKGVVDALKDVSFVGNPEIADIAVIPIEYDYRHTVLRSTLLLDLNGKQVKLIATGNDQIRIMDDHAFNSYMLGLADLLKLILKNSVTGNHIDLAKVPREISGLARSKGPRYVGIENVKIKY